MKRIKVKTAIAAIRKNGYKKTKGAFIRRSFLTNEILAACAIGQAALNLGVNPNALEQALPDAWWIEQLNDDNTQNYTLAKIADMYEEAYPHILNDYIIIK